MSEQTDHHGIAAPTPEQRLIKSLRATADMYMSGDPLRILLLETAVMLEREHPAASPSPPSAEPQQAKVEMGTAAELARQAEEARAASAPAATPWTVDGSMPLPTIAQDAVSRLDVAALWNSWRCDLPADRPFAHSNGVAFLNALNELPAAPSRPVSPQAAFPQHSKESEVLSSEDAAGRIAVNLIRESFGPASARVMAQRLLPTSGSPQAEPSEHDGPHIAAVKYARSFVMPLYQNDEEGTPYERGLARQIAQHWLTGYFAAQPTPTVSALRSVLEEVLVWMQCDLEQNGPGPSGGFQSRLNTVRSALASSAPLAPAVPVSALQALVTKWLKDWQRLDILGHKQSADGWLPDAWVKSAELRKRMDEVRALITAAQQPPTTQEERR